MIKIENVEVYGWEAAIRGMRNPKNSWEKSDSGICNFECDLECVELKCPWEGEEPDKCLSFHIGPNDLKLMKTLANAGTDHGKFLRMIGVSLDIVAPLYWWKEFDTYKVGTVANSCSTMHKIAARAFAYSDFSIEHLTSGTPNGDPMYYEAFRGVLLALNEARNCYLDTKDKSYWWQMIQLLPTSYNQRRTVTLNYAVLKNMYHARNAHKLDEWRDFCKWVESLPHSELITGNENE